jgi:MFS family permease
VAFLYFSGGLLSVTTQLVVGFVSDGIGRKPAVLLMGTLTATGTLMLYRGDGAWVPAGWLLMVAAYLGLDIMLSALGSELFPTAYRSTASSARSVTANVGATLGLVLEGVLFTLTGSHRAAITWMLLPLLLVPIAIVTVPETARRELEPNVRVAETLADALREAELVLVCTPDPAFRNLPLDVVRSGAVTVFDLWRFLEVELAGRPGVSYVAAGRSADDASGTDLLVRLWKESPRPKREVRSAEPPEPLEAGASI